MKQIYDFEQYKPPALTEALLRQELQRRQAQWQTALMALGCFLFQVALVLLGYSAMDWYPWLSFLCFGYVVLSTTGCGVLAVAYRQKGGLLL